MQPPLAGARHTLRPAVQAAALQWAASQHSAAGTRQAAIWLCHEILADGGSSAAACCWLLPAAGHQRLLAAVTGCCCWLLLVLSRRLPPAATPRRAAARRLHHHIIIIIIYTTAGNACLQMCRLHNRFPECPQAALHRDHLAPFNLPPQYSNHKFAAQQLHGTACCPAAATRACRNTKIQKQGCRPYMCAQLAPRSRGPIWTTQCSQPALCRWCSTPTINSTLFTP